MFVKCHLLKMDFSCSSRVLDHFWNLATMGNYFEKIRAIFFVYKNVHIYQFACKIHQNINNMNIHQLLIGYRYANFKS